MGERRVERAATRSGGMPRARRDISQDTWVLTFYFPLLAELTRDGHGPLPTIVSLVGARKWSASVRTGGVGGVWHTLRFLLPLTSSP